MENFKFSYGYTVVDAIHDLELYISRNRSIDPVDLVWINGLAADLIKFKKEIEYALSKLDKIK